MEIFPISPASAKPVWFVAMGCAVLMLVLGALLYTLYWSRHCRAEVGTENLRLVGDFWGRSIPLATLKLSEARVLALERTSEYWPQRRTFGTGLPGYASGWFRLRGGEKAIVFLTSRQNVAYIPTTAGYSVLLSVADPQRFIAALSRRRP